MDRNNTIFLIGGSKELLLPLSQSYLDIAKQNKDKTYFFIYSSNCI